MIKNILPFAAIAIMVFFGACSKEEVPEIEPEETVRTITLTALMPEDDPATRVSLTQDGLNIKLKWEISDPIKFLFVQGTTVNEDQSTTITSIANEGKKGYFTIAKPWNIDFTKPFTLYGVYGGGDIKDSKVTLSQQAWNSGKLANIETNNNVMLFFKHDFGESANLDVSVNFKHLGSLFCVHLKNSSTLPTNYLSSIGEVRLAGVGGGETEWGYNGGTTAEQYDLVNGKFVILHGLTNYIRIKTPTAGLANGASMEIWGWFPPLPDKIWPELKLELGTWNLSPAIATSINTKPARTAPTPAGRTFHFFAEWDGTELRFVSRAEYEGPGDAQ